MATPKPLTPAAEMAHKNAKRFPDESAQNRTARTALPAEEIELRRDIERVAQQRCTLPPGGVVSKPYQFIGEYGPVAFADLFGDKQTLAVYSYMFGPKRERPCPTCTSLLSVWDGEALDVGQNIALAIVARSPIERLLAVKEERGWRHLTLFSDVSSDYTRDCANADDADIPAFNVFTRGDGSIRYFWSGEMGGETADPGQGACGAPDLMPLWTILDSTLEGRRAKWHPKLDYPTQRPNRRGARSAKTAADPGA